MTEKDKIDDLNEILNIISDAYHIPFNDLEKTLGINGTRDEGSEGESIWLIPWLKRRIKENRNANLIFVGDTGSGKSYSAIYLGEQVDPNFSVDRIVFTTRDFIHLVNSDLPKGSFIIYDDAGLGIPAREWQNISAKVFGLLFQGFRYKNLISAITVPDMSFIERQSRVLMHLMFEATGKHGIMKPFFPFHLIRGDDMLSWKYPETIKQGHKMKVTLQKFGLASSELLKAYEEKKQAYMEMRNRKFEEDLKIAEETEETQKEIIKQKLIEAKNNIERRKDLIEKASKLRKEGFTMQEIAKKLNISVGTVNNLLRNTPI